MMTFRLAVAVVCGSILATLAPANAASKHRTPHAQGARHAAVPSAAHPTLGGRGSAQPHMVQVKPGVWISSWGCITDEGNGRWLPCGGGTRE
jgi:hypothetical protein